MRVCIMNDNFYRGSGVAIAIRRIAEALSRVEYCIAGCWPDNFVEDLSWVPAGRYERFDLKARNPLRLASEILRFKRWFKAQGCDLVHCHHRRVSVLLRSAGVPVLYTGHLAFRSAAWFRFLHPRRMTAVTPSVAKNLRETTGREALACIGNPVQFSEVPPGIEREKVGSRAVCIARLEPVKGHKHLLAAWKLLRDRGHRYELDLVGEGSLRGELEAQVRSDGTQELIHFCGFTQDVSSAISNSLFAVLVSEVEGQGIVTIEAAARGRPSLLTAVPGSIDLLPPGRLLTNGVQFGSVMELANALEEWFAHPKEVVEEGERFFRFLKGTSDPNRIAREYEEIYLKVLLEA
jgi:glycosyltransferase involved in cell wall biosynthesis